MFDAGSTFGKKAEMPTLEMGDFGTDSVVVTEVHVRRYHHYSDLDGRKGPGDNFNMTAYRVSLELVAISRLTSAPPVAAADCDVDILLGYM